MTIGKCIKCGSIIESKGNRHSFVSCRCGSSFVDGGDEYSRFGGDVLIWNDELRDWEDPKGITWESDECDENIYIRESISESLLNLSSVSDILRSCHESGDEIMTKEESMRIALQCANMIGDLNKIIIFLREENILRK